MLTVGSYKSDNFSLKWELPTCSHPPSSNPLFWRKEGAKQAALLLMKNSHFNRTLYAKRHELILSDAPSLRLSCKKKPIAQHIYTTHAFTSPGCSSYSGDFSPHLLETECRMLVKSSRSIVVHPAEQLDRSEHLSNYYYSWYQNYCGKRHPRV